MDLETKVSKLLSLSADESIADQLRAKLTAKPEFTVYHSFEPNGRLTFAHALRYAIASKIVQECGGKYILFIADVRSSQDECFKDIDKPLENDKKPDNEEKPKKDKKSKKPKLTAQERKMIQDDCINRSIEYALNILENLGVSGPHLNIMKSSEFSLDNYDLFYNMVSNSAKLSLNDVKSEIPNSKVLFASQLVAPCLQATEIQFLKADIVLCPENLFGQMNILKTIIPSDELPVVIRLPQIVNLKNTNPGKPDPKNYYFFEDNKQVLEQKSNGAFCTDSIEENPVFQYLSYIFLPFYGKINLNGKEYTSIKPIINDFKAMDKKAIKGNLAELVDNVISPIRQSFNDPYLNKLSESISLLPPTIQ